MATADKAPDINLPLARPGAELLVLLAPMPRDEMEAVLANLSACFLTEDMVIAAPEDALPPDSHPSLRLAAAPAGSVSWILTAGDFVNAYELADKHEARGILMLGPESNSLAPSALRDLATAVLSNSIDLAVPCYDLAPHAALVNSAILYPLTRALFASQVRFPLAVDLGLSIRMAERLAGAAQRVPTSTQGETPLWPVNEATAAEFAIAQFDAGPRVQPQPTGADLNTILPLVTEALFSDIEAKAAFWQRSRELPPAFEPVPLPDRQQSDSAVDVGSMLQAFQLAYTNLQEVWRIVLPPQSLLGLKRLSETEGIAFRMPEVLWARIVFDFLLAFRLRTINRGHLFGALIPLYLAWVASHINITASGTEPERHIEAVASAFEAEKPYMVARWRWPDRFNP